MLREAYYPEREQQYSPNLNHGLDWVTEVTASMVFLNHSDDQIGYTSNKSVTLTNDIKSYKH